MAHPPGLAYHCSQKTRYQRAAVRLQPPTHLLTGLVQPDDRYRLTAWLFLRLIALIYLAAFVSTALEITGLVG